MDFELAEKRGTEELKDTVMSVETEVQQLIIEARSKLKEAANKVTFAKDLSNGQMSEIWHRLLKHCGGLLALREVVEFWTTANRETRRKIRQKEEVRENAGQKRPPL